MPQRDHFEFEDRSVAKNYLISFRCYGSWLHGDERGSVDRRYFNRFGTPRIAPNSDTVSRKARMLKGEPFYLGTAERRVVEAAVREVCRFRGYALFALNVRTEHLHLVVANNGVPERMMDAFKAYATRALRSAGLADSNAKVWSRHGSTRYLWSEDHITAAVDYVENGQGGELPQFGRG